jgi:predicted nucleotidyltransferase
MNAELQSKMRQVISLCQEHGIARLDVFGSAARTDFDPQKSDYDFIVEFEDIGPGTNYGFRFLDFADALESLLGRKVDILTQDSIKNPYLKQAIDEDRRTIYEARHPVATS